MVEDIIGRVMLVQDFSKKEIMEAFYWMILGDGCIEQSERGNYRIAITHSKEHKDYIIWKASIIERVTSFSIKPVPAHEGCIRGETFVGGEALRLRSAAHPWFTKVWERLYGTVGRKALDPMALSLLGPIGLSILYQDDGSYHYSSDAGHNIMIHKLGLSEFELQALAKDIVDKYGIIFRLNACKGRGMGYRLRLRGKDREAFFSLIEPYIVPSMMYKIGKGSKPSKA